MAISIHLEPTETELFCSSKWWGDPDLPADMAYPTIPVTEEGETYDYPLTFVCQIDCEDLAPLDPEGRLPHQGMFYVFAALDEYAGYVSPVHNGLGEWPKGQVVVKYTKQINFETFRSAILVDDDDAPLTEPALRMRFAACPDDAPCTRLLGIPWAEEVRQACPDRVNFLQIDSGTAGLQFYDEGMLHLLYDDADFQRGNWRRAHGWLYSQ